MTTPTTPPAGNAPDTRWGPPTREYHLRPEANFSFTKSPDRSELFSAINHLLFNPTAVTLKMLEDILYLVHFPYLLNWLVHKNAVEGCMLMLENYTSRNGQNSSILEHGFGFMGLHVLALVLQAGLLHNINTFFDRPSLSREGMRAEDVPWDVKAPVLEDAILPILSELISKPALYPDGSHHSVSGYQIEMCHMPNEDERACLPSIGGFLLRDAALL
ncbi:cytochrome P450 family protein [Ceratobasidium sp. AG-Ba]|nr:cytochrome P450 family protein [Ceratobasidium sp. AG-Ba]